MNAICHNRTNLCNYQNHSISSNLTSTENFLTMTNTTKTTLYICYAIIFVFGAVGNTMVIYIMGIKNKHVSSCDIHIVSLATADILTAIFAPLVAVHDLMTDFERWYLLGTYGCKLFVSITHITMLASVFCLIVISFGRQRVISSSKTIRHSRKKSILVNIFIWLLSIAAVSPYIHALEMKYGQCWAFKWTPLDTFIYYSVYVGLSCFLPVVLLIGIYSAAAHMLRRKEVPGEDKRLYEKRKKQFKRIIQMFGCIVVLFFILTTPLMIFQFIVSYYGTFDLNTFMQHHQLFHSLNYAFYTLSNFNCCGNPFIYAKMHNNVRKSLTKHIMSLWRSRRTNDMDGSCTTDESNLSAVSFNGGYAGKGTRNVKFSEV